MIQVPTMTRSRLVLHFTEANPAELCETSFQHLHLAPAGFRAFRGKDLGAHPPHAGTFQWTGAVKVLVFYLLRCAAWGRRNPDLANGTTFPCLKGGRPSAALTLNNALSKKTDWICDMFGKDRRGRPNLLDLLLRSNADLKFQGQPVVLRLDQDQLSPCSIEVAVGCQRVEDADEIERLASLIEQSWRPKEGQGTLIRFAGTIDDWTADKQRQFAQK